MSTTLTSKTETAGHPQIASGEEAMAIARSMAGDIGKRAAVTDEKRRVPDETIADLAASGLFNIVTPKLFGGSELGFADLVSVTAEIASNCGSTGWVYGVLAGHSWLLNLFPLAAQQEVFEDPNALMATVFRLNGEVTEVDGGYRLVNGEGRFCSGIDFADWVIIGNAIKKADGSVDPCFFNIPKSDIEIVDDWYTTGMRGTGSRSIKIKDAFIPAHRACRLEEMVKGVSPGAAVHKRPIYRMPFGDLAPFSIIGAPIGMAKGALNAYAGFTGKMAKSLSPIQLAEMGPKFNRIGEAAADIDAALAVVVEDARRVDTAKDPSDLTPVDRARIPRNWAYAAQKSRYAATRLFEAAGGGTIYDGNPMQRIWRDVNSAAQHFAFTWDTAMPNYGRVLSDLPLAGPPPRK